MTIWARMLCQMLLYQCVINILYIYIYIYIYDTPESRLSPAVCQVVAIATVAMLNIATAQQHRPAAMGPSPSRALGRKTGL